MASSSRLHQSVTLQQATENSPLLARLAERVRDADERLRLIKPLLPPALRGAVKAGPVDGEQWCLIVDNNATAAKLRQLLPALSAHLRSRGLACSAIRLKVQSRTGR